MQLPKFTLPISFAGSLTVLRTPNRSSVLTGTNGALMTEDSTPITHTDPPQRQHQADRVTVWRPFASTAQLGRQMISVSGRQSGTPLDWTFSIWLLGLLPAIFACLRLMTLARGNTETLKSLMQNLNVTALVLATIIPLGSSLLTWWLFFSIIVKVGSARKPGRWPSLVLLLLLVGFIDFFAMPLRYILINLGCFVVLVSCMVGVVLMRHFSHPAAEKVNTGMAQAWAVMFVAAPLLFWLSSGVWLPKERLTVAAKVTEPVYVLSYDERWVKYMDEDRVVHIVRTPEVTSRDAVGASKSVWYQTPSLLWQEWRSRHQAK